MSAIDWLSRSVSAPAVLPPAVGGPGAGDGLGAPSDIAVSVLGAQSLDALGIVPATVSGLPRDLWAGTTAEDAARLLGAEPLDTLPALQSLLYTLLLAETDPPAGADPHGALFLARVDRLLDLGALDEAQALLELTDLNTPELFRRYFDVALLLGQEDRACKKLQVLPEVAPTFPTRIFCLARAGDWNAAALTLRTAEALNFVSAEQSALIERFLDPDLADGAAPLPPPTRPSPLVWRMMEAIGQPMPTNTLPVAFAQGDLRTNTGWKSRIEAGERLARTGALPPNRLLGLYTEARPAASGGVWDRAAAVQALEAALAAKDKDAVARALPAAWQAMAAAELEEPLARLFGRDVAALPLVGEAAATAFRLGLLSESYEAVASAHRPADAEETFLQGLARGQPGGLPTPSSLGRAIAAAFAEPAPVPQDLAALASRQRLGEAVLAAIQRVTDGTMGDLRGVTEGLALFRSVGLEDVARRTALQLLLLERRG